MTVYVDTMQAPYGRMKMCHMVADTHDELLGMARRIGVDEKWIQNAGQAREHFDICLSKKRLAIANGAVELSRMDLARVCRKKRKEAT